MNIFDMPGNATASQIVQCLIVLIMFNVGYASVIIFLNKYFGPPGLLRLVAVIIGIVTAIYETREMESYFSQCANLGCQTFVLIFFVVCCVVLARRFIDPMPSSSNRGDGT